MLPDLATVDLPVSRQDSAKKFSPNCVVKSCHDLSGPSTQSALRLAFGAHHAAKDAPMKLVYRLLSLQDPEAAAIDICMRSGKLKNVYVAACLGVHESYVSKLRHGQSVPRGLVEPLCAALQSRLLAQVRAELSKQDEREELANLLQEAA